MVHIFRPQSLLEAMDWWFTFPEYRIIDMIRRKPISFTESEIWKISKAKLNFGYTIYFSSTQLEGSFNSSLLPESLSDKPIFDSFLMREDWKLIFKGFYKNSLTLIYLALALVFTVLTMTVVPLKNPLIFIIGLLTVPAIFTFLYFYFRVSRIRHTAVRMMFKMEAILLAWVTVITLYQVSQTRAQFDRDLKSKVEMSSHSK